jgi:hypothetical protein
MGHRNHFTSRSHVLTLPSVEDCMGCGSLSDVKYVDMEGSDENWGGCYPLCAHCRRYFWALPDEQSRERFHGCLHGEFQRRLHRG